MKELSQNGNTPMLFPYEPTEYWQNIRQIIREEVAKMEKETPKGNVLETPGLTYKPLLKIMELCTLFQVTKPTIYSWIKAGKTGKGQVKEVLDGEDSIRNLIQNLVDAKEQEV